MIMRNVTLIVIFFLALNLIRDVMILFGFILIFVALLVATVYTRMRQMR